MQKNLSAEKLESWHCGIATMNSGKRMQKVAAFSGFLKGLSISIAVNGCDALVFPCVSTKYNTLQVVSQMNNIEQSSKPFKTVSKR